MQGDLLKQDTGVGAIGKRKSLKRLRKALRLKETGDPLAANLSVEEKQALDASKETQRLAKRAWPGLNPELVFELPPEMILSITPSSPPPEATVPPDVKDTKGNKLDTQAKQTEDKNDGSCVGNLTDAHRSAVHGRDEMYAKYYEFFHHSTQELYQKYTQLLNEEELWYSNWLKLIQTMQQES